MPTEWRIFQTSNRVATSSSFGAITTQSGFMRTLSNFHGSTAGFSAVQYSPSDHFGGRSFNVLSNVCSGGNGYFVTKYANVSRF